MKLPNAKSLLLKMAKMKQNNGMLGGISSFCLFFPQNIFSLTFYPSNRLSPSALYQPVAFFLAIFPSKKILPHAKKHLRPSAKSLESSSVITTFCSKIFPSRVFCALAVEALSPDAIGLPAANSPAAARVATTALTAATYTYDTKGNFSQVLGDTVPAALAAGVTVSALTPSTFTYARVPNNTLISTVTGPVRTVAKCCQQDMAIEPGFRDCIRDAFRKCFGIRALFFALDAPQGAPRQSPMCDCSKPLRNPPEANRGIRVERYLRSLVGLRANYSIYGQNFRDFSDIIYDYLGGEKDFGGKCK
jgi:hypothetical protein